MREQVEQRIVERDRESLHDADQHRRDERARRSTPARRRRRRRTRSVRAPRAMFGSVSNVKPPITPARPASALPTREHQHENARHVVAERADHARMRQRGLDDQSDARALERRCRETRTCLPRSPSSAPCRTGNVCRRVTNSGKVDRPRGRVFAIGLRPQIIDHDLVDQVGESEREQDLRDVTAAVHAAQAVALDRRAEYAAPAAARSRSAGQKPIHCADLVREVGAEHEHAGVREVEHAHHAEDQRQAAARA